MSKKIKTAGIFLLLVCLFSLSTARITEAAITPDKIITRLQVRLDRILANAADRTNELLDKVTGKVNKFNNGKISHKKFCSALDSVQETLDIVHKRLDRKLAKITQKMIKKLQRVGADPSYITIAEDIRDDTHTEEHALFDELDTAIDDARHVPSPWCT